VLNLETVPVANATKRGDGVKAPTNGTLLGLFADALKKQGAKKVTPAEARAFVSSVGRPEGAYSQLLAYAVETGLLKKKGIGRNTYYEVTRNALHLKAIAANKQSRA